MDSGDDPAIATSSAEPLVAFVPGEDMIAVHKRAMKAREEGRWGNQLVPSAPKQFNAADYLLPSKAAPEPEPQVADTAFQSRFQRFFAADMPKPSPPPPPPPPQAPVVDDHMARLMGMLRSNVSREAGHV
jgi:hypothetical protein